MHAKADRLHIVTYPHPSLRRKAAAVDAVTDEVRAVAARMLELMHEARGVGLAAPQVDLPWRLFVANPTGEPEDDHVYINPVLREPSPETIARTEGCLSIPEVEGEITRPVAVSIEALDADGNPVTERSDELIARIWQHETDHLDAVLIIDRMTPMDKTANRRSLKEMEGRAGGR
ncbi:MAG: peptide deformylase [Planctomycetaceae bacterium]|nr:peptide deformylase [Planctomycetaceae bacterium]